MTRHWLFSVFFAAAVGIAVYFFAPHPTKIDFAYPYTNKVDPSQGISCEAIVGSVLYGNNIGADHGLHGELVKGTDKFAVELDDNDTFRFLSRASVEVGVTKSNDNWRVLQDNTNFLIAELTKFGDVPIDNFANLFYLDKENGMALLIKSTATGLGVSTPEAQTYLMQCI